MYLNRYTYSIEKYVKKTCLTKDFFTAVTDTIHQNRTLSLSQILEFLRLDVSIQVLTNVIVIRTNFVNITAPNEFCDNANTKSMTLISNQRTSRSSEYHSHYRAVFAKKQS